MKFFIVTILVLLIGLANAQIQDDFEDGNILVNPKWEGDVIDFTTENGFLRSNSISDNDNFSLATFSNSSLTRQWELFINLKFSTSSKNLVNFFILSDSLNLKNTRNGYFIQIGGTDDKLSFVKRHVGATTHLFSSAGGTISAGNSSTRIKIIRDQDTTFHFFVDYTGGTHYMLIGSVKDTEVLASSYSGINIFQSTASFFKKHFFDDFYTGPIVQDKEPPVLDGISQLNLKKLQLSFNENLDSISAVNISNYSISKGVGNPSSAIISNNKQIELTFSNAFENPQNYQLTIENVKDIEGNVLDTIVVFISLVANSPKVHELLITELLPVPEPEVSLPKGEFIELFNASSVPLDLGVLKIEDLISSKELPSRILFSKEYVILCNLEDSLAYSAFGKVIAISGLPSLNNSSDRIRVTDNVGKVIHEVSYSSSVFPSEKSNGWSMEMTDINNPCHFFGNWEASISNLGGTPGQENSVKSQNLDKIEPELLSIYPISDTKVSLYFNEPLLESAIINNGFFRIVETNEIPDSILSTDSLNKYILCFSSPFLEKELYSLEYSGGEDCVGNRLGLDTILFGLPSEIELGSLLINEILYEPLTGGEEFLEIYNNTALFLDLKDLKIGKKVDGKYEEVEFVNLNGRLIAPNSFVVLTKDPSNIASFYSVKDSLTFLKTMSLPSLSNGGMELVLLNLINEEVDAVNYNPKWHFEIVADTKGVSLERISKVVSNNSYNWTSAASNIGFGTPGVENSQSREVGKTSSTIALESKSFSPNGDGYQDVLLINYNMAAANTTANVYVFNEHGALIKQIANNETLSNSGIISWDGEREIGGKANIGIYVLLFEYFTANGKVEREKQSFVLVGY